MDSNRLHDLPASERPRERLRLGGAEALALAELLAILLRTGLPGASATDVGRQLYARFGSLDALARADLQELQEIRGVGPDKAVTLKAAFELSRRLSTEQRFEPPLMSDPEKVAALIREEALSLTHERLWAFLLNTRQQLIRCETIGDGLLNQVLIHPREVFRPAILANAASLSLAHNHPSGDPTPSDADIQRTRDLARAGRLLEVEVDDHLIMGRRTESRPVDWVSLRQLGVLARGG